MNESRLPVLRLNEDVWSHMGKKRRFLNLIWLPPSNKLIRHATALFIHDLVRKAVGFDTMLTATAEQLNSKTLYKTVPLLWCYPSISKKHFSFSNFLILGLKHLRSTPNHAVFFFSYLFFIIASALPCWLMTPEPEPALSLTCSVALHTVVVWVVYDYQLVYLHWDSWSIYQILYVHKRKEVVNHNKCVDMK